ncbi:hypothetical protein SEA_WENTWORTH_2 [Streptomyces phage Wentworth]|nr:hypothetical protein SEA_WENTWORTH_2 [Streptomyces phage Wentworth]
MHKSWILCSLGESGAKHKQSECRWCGRVRRNDKMRRWDGQMECRDSHGCSRVHKQRRLERERG